VSNGAFAFVVLERATDTSAPSSISDPIAMATGSAIS
jgi:hypothetical protein